MGRPLDLDALLERMSRKLDLRTDQQEKMKGLVEQFRASHGDAMARARELRDALGAAGESGTRPSREDVEALASQYGNPGRELWPALEKLRDDARSVLDPEQRRKLDDLRKRWRHDCPGGRRWDPGVDHDRSAPRPPPVPPR
jgi:Spy/CpxP family protein refolding chaperone